MATTVAPRDPANVAAINSVMVPSNIGGASASAVNSPAINTAPSAAVAGGTDMNAQLDRALTNAAQHQPTNVQIVAQPSPFNDSAVGESPATTATHIAEDEARQNQAAAPKKPARSLWDRLFGSDDNTAKTAATAAPAVTIVPVDDMHAAPPIEPVQAMPQPAPLPTPVAVSPQSAVGAVTVASAQPMPVPQSVYVPPVVTSVPAPVMAAAAPQPTAPAPVTSVPIITQAQPFPLPPPPEPLIGHDPRPPLAASTAVPITAPGNVQVEEAKRVPLTQGTVPPPMPVAAAPLPAPNAAMPAAAPVSTIPAMLSPSSTIGEKTLWAEVGSFPDNQTALAYWEQYRRSNPDFPVVRVRVASSVQAQRHGNGVNLRIGPFSHESTVSHLCETMPNPNDDLRCGVVTDMGVASAMQPQGTLPASRYAQ